MRPPWPQVLGEPADAALPDTAELFLIPTPPRRGQSPGTGWLLGLHGPAGASLGRFAHALGTAGAEALAEIAAAEGQTRASGRGVRPLCRARRRLRASARAPPRARDLAVDGAADDLTLADLALVADPARPDALALRERASPASSTVVPSPLWRVRSSTAPAGAARLAVGWTLQRQHAPVGVHAWTTRRVRDDCRASASTGS